MKKALKIVFILIAFLVVALTAAVLSVPLWLGPVVKPIANSAVPRYTLAGFDLGHIYFNPYKGRFELGSLRIDNPNGYRENTALSLSNLTVVVKMSSLCSDTIVVKELVVEDLFVSYVNGGENGVDNFTQIQYNIAGGKENYEKGRAEALEEPAGKDSSVTDSDGETSGTEKKFIIEKLVISDIRLKYGGIVIPVPKLTLKDIGKKSDGVTATRVCALVGNEIIMKAMDFGRGLSDLLGTGAESAAAAAMLLGDESSKAATAIGDKTKEVSSLVGTKTKDAASRIGTGAKDATAAAGSEAKKAAENIGSGAVKAASAVGSGAVKAASAVGGGAVKAVESVGSGAVKAVESVGDGTKKAADALKNIFK